MYILSVILLVATLLFVAVNLFISFYIRRDVLMALKLAERRDAFLREEQERLRFLREERQTLMEELKQCSQDRGVRCLTTRGRERWRACTSFRTRCQKINIL